MGAVRRCLGCSTTYPVDKPSCPKCGSHAADVEEKASAEAKPKPPRRRKA